VQIDTGSKRTASAVYLVEIVDEKRVIRDRFELSGSNSAQQPPEHILIFISGSINSGKTSTSKLLAEKLGAELVNVDDLNDTIPNFNLATDLDKSMDLAIGKVNEYLAAGNDVVANYVVRQRDFGRFAKEISTKKQYVITLSPRLEVAQSKRGDRELSEWEVARVKHHYDTGVATPAFGYIIDNSDISLEEAVEHILKIIGC
jgi:cytidylate kinase